MMIQVQISTNSSALLFYCCRAFLVNYLLKFFEVLGLLEGCVKTTISQTLSAVNAHKLIAIKFIFKQDIRVKIAVKRPKIFSS